MSARIVMIEDDFALATMVAEYLAPAGFDVEHHGLGERGLRAIETGSPDAVILDVTLPDVDGLEICRRVRARSDVPVLMLTARGEETDRIVGLELGADDYLPKPFNPRELLARLRAILRRGERVAARRDGTRRFGRLEIDRDRRQVRIGGSLRSLTTHQFELLWALADHPGRVLSRERLLDLVHANALEAYDRSIDVHVSRIRAAIEDDPRHPRRVITVRGAGYVFASEQD